VVIAAQHTPDVTHGELREAIVEEVIKKVIPRPMTDGDTKYFINATGKFVIGGPMGDCGLTGRKIIVDTYGGQGSHGGGCFSGKDPSKVDRSASYMARHIAKNVVAAGISKKCEVQIAYAIGVAQPVSVMVDLMGMGTVPKSAVQQAVVELFDLRPAAIIEYLDLLRPIFRKTAAYGHFGRTEPEFMWESTHMADALREKVGL
jgi:S-adenosylmethionine synthetase